MDELITAFGMKLLVVEEQTILPVQWLQSSKILNVFTLKFLHSYCGLMHVFLRTRTLLCRLHSRDSWRTIILSQLYKKFDCPGHSSVQEVDNIHSNIERITRYAEIYSPIALIRDLKSMRRRRSVRIIQMQKHNFMDYQKCIMPLKFNEIPFTKVKCLKYDKCLPFNIGYKLSYSATDFRTAHIEIRQTRARTNKQPEFLPRPAQSNKVPIISQDKKKDITCMLKYMPEVDRQFYKALKLVNNE
ncbi:uncharacterized protein LOC123564992 [Mercenaria mercenaria]|uniref:uncharacterized protein LOC123564992 n=1 Tax=Mercenaria mercenaria TaxID=6596 RepID=UPI00234E7F51|nr:uncharacterized protein LOC123564992 [Mercenaria mercenaria]